MKSSSFKTGLISVVVAVVLWVVATWFEDDTRWVPPDIDTNAADSLSIVRPREDSAVRAGTDVVSCTQAEAEMVASVSDSQYCQTDDDCTLFDYGYPIQCMTSVARTEITALRLEYRRYEESCAYRVYYDCPTGQMERAPVCRNNRCEVILDDGNPLTDETLRHLGIEDL